MTIPTKYILLTAACLSQTVPTQAQNQRPSPEKATGFAASKAVTTPSAMVVAANPLAARAGLKILNQGGNAIDAAIATQLVLNLVEPQSSGIGGGAFLLYWENCKQNLVALDGRETAPQDSSPNRFIDTSGRPLPFRAAMKGRRSIGTPGLVKLMSTAHKKYGRLDWKKLFVPAIKLAEKGFAVSPRLHKLLNWRRPESFGPTARAYFFDAQNNPRPVGYILKNPAFAQTLKELAEKGQRAFYQPGSTISSNLIQKVWRRKERNISYKDLAFYRVKNRKPLCFAYHGYKICSMGPPSSGAIVIGQVLGMTQGFPVAKSKDHLPQIMRLVLAQKLAFADRKRYVADPDFVDVPKSLLSKNYLQQRARLLPTMEILNQNKPLPPASPYRALLRGVVKAGSPPKSQAIFGKDNTTENDGTSHISIMDAEGNALSWTTTIEMGFGSGLMTGGFLLNNELTDFSFLPKDRKGRAVANRLEPRKRPRSSMSPTIIFDPAGKPFAVLGSPGGSRIPLYVLKSIVAIIDWDMSAQQAASFPNFGSRNRKNRGMEIEKGKIAHSLAGKIQKSPLLSSRSAMNSGLHIIIQRKGHLEGGVDPRREGLAVGY